MILGATRGGTADALLQEMSESQPMLLNWMRGFVTRMPPKAYRWVAEMEEIATFQGEDAGAHDMYLGIARFYEQIAAVGRPEAGRRGGPSSTSSAPSAARPSARAPDLARSALIQPRRLLRRSRIALARGCDCARAAPCIKVLSLPSVTS